ncbi:MAG TPA: siroheme synthase [Desulfobulbaceae bacterium]|nr:siroheme synthase [Desulfobulbaceae bacterium]
MYPICLDIKDKLCVVVGGGEVALRKVQGLLAAGARVRVVSPEVVPELDLLAGQGRIEWQRKTYASGDISQALLVFAATDDRATQQLVCRQADSNGQLVNVADDPACCNFQVPACLRRGDLTIAISTNGKSPAVSAMIRGKLEREFGPEYEVLLNLMARVRQQVVAGNHSQAERKKIYNKILHEDIVEWIRRGKVDLLRAHLQTVLGPETEVDINALNQDIA